jgi:hypothetical protein
MEGPVLIDRVLKDPFLSSNGDAEWVSGLLGRWAMLEAAHIAGVGLGVGQPGSSSHHKKR